jgi:hypothetical protein
MSDGENSCACGGSCGCGGHEETQQVYLTREEYITRLQEYLVQLNAEIKSVEEELAELRETA